MESHQQLVRRLNAEWQGCTGCDLWRTRINVVLGVGPVPSPLVIVGDGPGAQEDSRGTPFVGESGELLDMMLSSARIERSSTYITSVVACRPQGDGIPEVEQITACYPRLMYELYMAEPVVILALGATAAATLLGKKVTMREHAGRMYPVELIGRDHSWKTTVLVTYHPSYLIRNGLDPDLTGTVFEHIVMAADVLTDVKRMEKTNGDKTKTKKLISLHRS